MYLLNDVNMNQDKNKQNEEKGFSINRYLARKVTNGGKWPTGP